MKLLEGYDDQKRASFIRHNNHLFLNTDPCMNGGTCHDAVNSFVCTCNDGFEGERCETDVDDCKSSPCSNGATCTDYVNSFVCTCAVSRLSYSYKSPASTCA